MKLKKEPILLYLAFTFVFTLLLVFLSMLRRAEILYNYFGYIVMCCPGIAGIVTNRMYGRRENDLGLCAFVLKYNLLGMAIPVIYLVLSYSVYGVLFAGTFALTLPDSGALIALIPISLFFALGEELGWRGFLAPALTNRFGYIRASILTGLIWWIWHLSLGNPLIYEYYYYPGATISFAVCLIAISFVANALRLRSQSVWPATLLHGIHNLTLGIFESSTLGDSKAFWVGEVGLITIVLIALSAIITIIKYNKGTDMISK